jgi:antiviral helicase SKI2
LIHIHDTPVHGVEKPSDIMVDSLVSALERVRLESISGDAGADDWIDHILEERRPRKRAKQDQEELKRELEQKYLTPSTSFSTEWLNNLQQ